MNITTPCNVHTSALGLGALGVFLSGWIEPKTLLDAVHGMVPDNGQQLWPDPTPSHGIADIPSMTPACGSSLTFFPFGTGTPKSCSCDEHLMLGRGRPKGPERVATLRLADLRLAAAAAMRVGVGGRSVLGACWSEILTVTHIL
jgi:hypothetical protein